MVQHSAVNFTSRHCPKVANLLPAPFSDRTRVDLKKLLLSHPTPNDISKEDLVNHLNSIFATRVFNSKTLNIGGVAGLRRIRSASAVARKVLDYTTHSLLVGDLATAFAKNFGFKEESLSTNYSERLYSSWQKNTCQPNFWTNVNPNPTTSCGPYSPADVVSPASRYMDVTSDNHDTIGMIAVDQSGDVAAGTSTNGASFKIAGRVGDSAIPGAGCYADNDVGAAAATGDGDVMMRLLPSFVAVEEMRRGASPREAAKTAIYRIIKKYPTFQGALVVLRNDGKFAAACHGLKSFPYVVSSTELGSAQVITVPCD